MEVGWAASLLQIRQEQQKKALEDYLHKEVQQIWENGSIYIH